MSLIAPRRPTRVLHVGDVKVGGANPIVVQSMATADTRDPITTLRQVRGYPGPDHHAATDSRIGGGWVRNRPDCGPGP